MDQVIMPEIMTQKLIDMLASNPDILKMLVTNQPGEEVIVGKNCTLDCNSNPTNVKLVFCNVTLCANDTEDECNKGCNTGKTEKQIGNCHIKINRKGHEQAGMHWGETTSEISQLNLEVAVLEARMEENQKILAHIPRQISNRKLVARCKKSIIEVEKELAEKKKDIHEVEELITSKEKDIPEAEEQIASKEKKQECGDCITEFWT